MLSEVFYCKTLLIASMRRSFALVLILILTVSSLMMVNSVQAQTTPSVPEFTVQFIDSSYDTQTTTSIDIYTGQNVTHAGTHVESRTIQISIKNEPFIVQDSTSNYYYNIRFKGHFEEEWHEAYNPNVNGLLGRDSGAETVFSLQGEYSSTEGLKLTPQGIYYPTFPPNAQIDFQVQAMIGYIHHADAMPFSADVFEGQTSGWSSTQTIAISDNSITTPDISPSPSSITPKPSDSPSQEPTATPDQPDTQTGVLFGLDWEQTAIVLLGVVVVLLVVVVVFQRKRGTK